MNTTAERIKYLTRKAQRGAISPIERKELAKLLGKNPNDYRSDDGLNALIGVALTFIAIAILSEMLKGGKR